MFGNMPIHIAALNGFTNYVKLLLEKSANVNSLNSVLFVIFVFSVSF